MAKKIQIDLDVKDNGSKELKKFSNNLENSFSKSIKSVKAFGLALAAAAGTAVGIGYFIKKSIDMAGEINDVSKKLGISTDALQEYRYAAKMAGVEQGELETSLQMFSRNLADARSNTGTMVEVVKKYGIALQDATGANKSMEQIMGDVANVIKYTTDSTERLQIVYDTFGRSGGALINILEGGAKGLDKMKNTAKELGIVIDAELIQKGDEAGDKLDTVATILKSQLTTAILQLSPKIIALSQNFIDWISNADNMKKISDGVKLLSDTIVSLVKFIDSNGGKTAGVIIGFMVGGPVGGVIGGALGAIVDQLREANKEVSKLKKLSDDIKNLSKKTSIESLNTMSKSKTPITADMNLDTATKSHYDNLLKTKKFAEDSLARTKSEQEYFQKKLDISRQSARLGNPEGSSFSPIFKEGLIEAAALKSKIKDISVESSKWQKDLDDINTLILDVVNVSKNNNIDLSNKKPTLSVIDDEAAIRKQIEDAKASYKTKLEEEQVAKLLELRKKLSIETIGIRQGQYAQELAIIKQQREEELKTVGLTEDDKLKINIVATGKMKALFDEQEEYKRQALEKEFEQQQEYVDAIKNMEISIAEIKGNYREADLSALELWYSQQLELLKGNKEAESKLNELYGLQRQELLKTDTQKWIDETNKMKITGADMAESISSSLSSGFESIIDGTKSLKDGLDDMFKSMINNVIKMVAEMYIYKAVASGMSMFGGSYADGGITPPKLPGAANGAVFNGPKTGYPVMMHGNEAVIPLKNGKVPVSLNGDKKQPVNVNMYITTQDASSFKRSRNQIISDIKRSVY